MRQVVFGMRFKRKEIPSLGSRLIYPLRSEFSAVVIWLRGDLWMPSRNIGTNGLLSCDRHLLIGIHNNDCTRPGVFCLPTRPNFS